MGLTGLVFSIGEAVWAFELSAVSEVLAGPALTPVPTAAPAVLGLCNRRGDILPVLSLSVLTGVADVPRPDERTAEWVVVVDTADGPGGLAATGRPTTADLGAAVAPGDGPAVVAVHRMQEDSRPVAVTLLDPAALLTPAAIDGER